MADEGPVAEEVSAFKREVDAGFDEALAEVTAALAAVPGPVTLPLPGLEPAAYPDPREDTPVLPSHAGDDPNPLQERLDLATDTSTDDDMTKEDAITEFAPDPRMVWGPRWLKGGQAEQEEEAT